MEAPKVTIEEVEAAIVGETYTVLPDGRTTICQLTLDNGFTVDGKSACVSAANFNEETGRKFAREKALDQVWFVLGFRLADKLAAHARTAFAAQVGEVNPVPDFVPPEMPVKPIEQGDWVHFIERVGDKVSEPMEAVVVKVLDPMGHTVAVTVFGPDGTPHARSKVSVVFPWMEIPEGARYFVRPKH